ncbi:hypothetical protein pb186bvf_017553 [Paramecium bursaria]
MSEIVPNQLFVAGYSKNKVTSENDVKDIFKGLAKIENVVYKGNYSFVVANKKIHFKNQTFNNEKDADDARQKLNGSTYQGQKLKVDIVDNRKGRRAGPTDQDECFKCGKSGHWYIYEIYKKNNRARDCKNGGRSRSPRRRRDSYSRSRHHRKRYRSTSRSYSSPSYSSSRSPRRRRHSRRDRRSRTPRRDRKRSNSPRRHSPSGSHSKSSISKKRGSSSDSRK